MTFFKDLKGQMGIQVSQVFLELVWMALQGPLV